MNENKKKIHELTEYLNVQRDLYYNENAPQISDGEYDSLFDELQKLERIENYSLSNSPTKSVGYEAKSRLNKVNHSIPLLSLKKTKEVDDIVKFNSNNDCIAMLKYDGLTVCIVYENGNLISASTRGNGYVGEDITHNAKTFKYLPAKIDYKKRLVVVGEAVIHTYDFDNINSKLPDNKKYANPRNLVSGSVRQLDSRVCAKRCVQWHLWDVLEGLDEYKLRSEKFNECAKMGFESLNCDILYRKSEKNNNKESIKYIIEELSSISELRQIPIDGIVFKYDDIEFSKMLGGTSHHNNDGIAFKFKDESEVTRLQYVKWQVGKTGQITPVAVFNSIELCGTVVSQATLHNISYIEAIGLKNNCEIEIVKSNEIIPQVIGVSSYSNSDWNVVVPHYCPRCGESTTIKNENGSKTLYCLNKNCCGRRIKKFSHFVSRDAMNIEGLSELTLDKLLSAGLIETFCDIYNLKNHYDDIIQIEGFNEKSANKLLKSIEKSRENSTLDKLIYSLSIPNIGKTTSKDIVKNFSNIDDLKMFISSIRHKTELKGIGNVAFCSFKEYFLDSDNVNLLNDLINIVQINFSNNTTNKYSGKKFVITGSFGDISRNNIAERIESMGGKVSSSVSSKTDYLIAGEKAGSKLEKAKSLGIEIINNLDFLLDN